MRLRGPGPIRGAAAVAFGAASVVALAGCAAAGPPPAADATSVELAPGDYWAYGSHWLMGSEHPLRPRAQWADGGATLRVSTSNGSYCPTVPVRIELVEEHVLRLDFDLLDPSARDLPCPAVGAEYSFDIPVPERMRGADSVRPAGWSIGTPGEEDEPILAEDVVPDGAAIDPASVVATERAVDPRADGAFAGAAAWPDGGARVSFTLPAGMSGREGCPTAPVASYHDEAGTTHVVLALSIPRDEADCGGPRVDFSVDAEAAPAWELRARTYDVPVVLRAAGAGNGRLVVHDAMFGAMELPLGG